MSLAVITRVELRNFKAFKQFSISLEHINILVGPNNSGKSTILNALRLLGIGIRRANAKSPELVQGPEGSRLGYRIQTEDMPMSLENIHTNYDNSSPTTARFFLSNGNELLLYFPTNGKPLLIPDGQFRTIRTPTAFKNAFPINLGFVPVLGPVEHDERLVEKETVLRSLSTHRASRHFRTYWEHFPEEFDDFADLVRTTWPNMDIKRPERVDLNNVVMFCVEERVDRELYWSGFGFQVWCQLLTHIVRSRNATLLVIDEPEIYLHPDLQRRLLGILKDAGPDILLATHSTEIISEAEPSDVLLISKSRRSAQRLRDTTQVQGALTLLGSGQNLTLTQLARTRRVLFVEGDDFKIIGSFAKQIGLTDIASKADFAVVATEGFSHWPDVKGLAWGMEKALGFPLMLGAIFDRDYRSEEEVRSIVAELKQHLAFAHIHQRKELENYLLVPSVLNRAVRGRLNDVAKRRMAEPQHATPTEQILEQITTPIRSDLQAQYIDMRIRFVQKSAAHRSTIMSEAIATFDVKWSDISRRMEIVPGKEIFSLLNKHLGENYGISLTPSTVIREFRREEIPSDLLAMLRQLDRFRQVQLDPNSAIGNA
jgi:energy-coupling factor transporter ATP-binding protein EcfA2